MNGLLGLRKMRCEFGAGRDARAFCEALQIVDLRSGCTARDDHFPFLTIDH